MSPEVPECPRCRGIKYLPFKKSQYEAGLLPCPDCLPPAQFTFSGFQSVDGSGGALNATRNWAGCEGLPWLVLIGTYGCGKTHLARAAYRKLLEGMTETVYVYAIDLFDTMRQAVRLQNEPDYVRRIERTYTTPGVLIIDDFGAERETGWVRERIEKILNHRYENNLRTMITSNLPLDEWPGAIASRASDRSRSCIVYMTAKDYRQRNHTK